MNEKEHFPKAANDQLHKENDYTKFPEKNFNQDKSVTELDITDLELEDDQEDIEDEETNLYSSGDDDYTDLDKSNFKNITMIRTANAHWEGNLKEGTGTLSTQSGVLENTNYSFKTRFEVGVKGTNPEELLAAAHAGCFTMAVAAKLNAKGFIPNSLDTEATLTMNDLGIVSMHLKISGSVPSISAEEFATITKDAEQNCFVSKALSIPISSEVHFEFENL